MQQALNYGDMHGEIPFVFSSNGDAFLFHDRTIKEGIVERELPLDSREHIPNFSAASSWISWVSLFSVQIS